MGGWFGWWTGGLVGMERVALRLERVKRRRSDGTVHARSSNVEWQGEAVEDERSMPTFATEPTRPAKSSPFRGVVGWTD